MNPSSPLTAGNDVSSSSHPLNHPSGFLPFLMSLAVWAAIEKAAVNFEKFGPPLHEDGPWHVFMLMMALQLPLMAYFAFAHRRDFKRAAPILGVQAALWAVSLAAAYYIPGLY